MAILLGEPLPVELMNTISFERGEVRDALATGAIDWLGAVGDRIAEAAGTPLEPGEGDVAALRDLRDAVRLLAIESTGDPRPPTGAAPTHEHAVETLNKLARTQAQLVWPPDGTPARSYRGGPVALIAHLGIELFAGPGRERLRACLAPNCVLFFTKDHPRREWCSAGCGNRARVARHYQRHHR